MILCTKNGRIKMFVPLQTCWLVHAALVVFPNCVYSCLSFSFQGVDKFLH